MKVAVVTPYYRESKRIIKRCIDSVAKQTHDDVIHVLVSDGYPQDWINDFTLHHLVIPNVGNFGDTPRAIGATYAAGLDVDAIIFLDADCWLPYYHVENLVCCAQESRVGIVTCPRNIWLDGEEMGICSESNGLGFNDTNCYLITKPYFSVCSAWAFKNQKDAIVGDRVFWNAVQRCGANIVRAVSAVNYQSDYAHHYQMFGKTPPGDSKVLVNGQVKKWGDVC